MSSKGAMFGVVSSRCEMFIRQEDKSWERLDPDDYVQCTNRATRRHMPMLTIKLGGPPTVERICDSCWREVTSPKEVEG